VISSFGNRPSVPAEERRELQRQFLQNLRMSNESTRSRKDWFDRWTATSKEMRAWRSFGASDTLIWPFAFEGKPQTCFEAMGHSHIESSGIRFSFLTALPGDLNRFAIEREDPDSNRGRLYFIRGDCRFELTVSQSVLRDGRWSWFRLRQFCRPADIAAHIEGSALRVTRCSGGELCVPTYCPVSRSFFLAADTCKLSSRKQPPPLGISRNDQGATVLSKHVSC
jgi:hypothetical protein